LSFLVGGESAPPPPQKKKKRIETMSGILVLIGSQYLVLFKKR
jgi:hypothetical protein